MKEECYKDDQSLTTLLNTRYGNDQTLTRGDQVPGAVATATTADNVSVNSAYHRMYSMWVGYTESVSRLLSTTNMMTESF